MVFLFFFLLFFLFLICHGFCVLTSLLVNPDNGLVLLVPYPCSSVFVFYWIFLLFFFLYNFIYICNILFTALENQFARNIFHDSLFYMLICLYMHIIYTSGRRRRNGIICIKCYCRGKRHFVIFTYRVIAFHVLKCTLCLSHSHMSMWMGRYLSIPPPPLPLHTGFMFWTLLLQMLCKCNVIGSIGCLFSVFVAVLLSKRKPSSCFHVYIYYRL